MKGNNGVKNKLEKIYLNCKLIVFVGKSFVPNKKSHLKRR